jgi:hypothetical protein
MCRPLRRAVRRARAHGPTIGGRLAGLQIMVDQVPQLRCDVRLQFALDATHCTIDRFAEQVRRRDRVEEPEGRR